MITEASIRRTVNDSSFFDEVVISNLRNANTAKWVSDCFVSNEVGYGDVIEKYNYKDDGVYRNAYIGVGPEQSFNYIASFRPVISIICDTRVDNMIWHLMNKVILEKSESPIQYLGFLLSRKTPVLLGHESLSIEELYKLISEAPISREQYQTNLIFLQKELEQRWKLDEFQLSIVERIFSNFFERQFSISVVDFSAQENIGAFVKFYDTLLAKTTKGNSYHFLSSNKLFHVVKFLSWYNRIIPIVGNLSEQDTISRINNILNHYNESCSCLYLSNIEAYIVDMYSISHSTIVNPNVDASLVGEYSVYRNVYNSFVKSLDGIQKTEDAIVIRSYMPFYLKDRSIGLEFLPENKAYLEIDAKFYNNFSVLAKQEIDSVFKTYLN